MLLTRHEVVNSLLGHVCDLGREGRSFPLKRFLLVSCAVCLPLAGVAYAESAPGKHHRRPVHRKHLPHQVSKKSAPAKEAPESASASKPNTQSSEDALLKGVPSGWNARVVGLGDAQQKAPTTPQSQSQPEAEKASEDLAKIKSGIPQPEKSRFKQPDVKDDRGEDHGKASSPSKVPAYPASTNRILIPVPPQMGIAAYQSGRNFVVVVDGEQPLDTSSLRGDGVFANITVSTLPKTTIITVPLPDTRRLFLSQQSNGWVLGDMPPPGTAYSMRQVITPKVTSLGLLFPMRRPGRVLSIKDPTTGETLAVGTSSFDDGGILSLRQGQGYDVWPSLEGVVIADHSPPKVELKRTIPGDLMTVGGKVPPDLDRAIYVSDVDLKWLGLKNLSMQDANARYRKALIDAADSSPQERFSKRLEAAKAAFNLGSFTEARAIAAVALEDDPEEAFRPDVRFLLGAIELLGGNPKGADLLDDQWPEGQQRAVLPWKGLYYAAKGGRDQDAAHYLASDFSRLSNYPEMLRDVILPPAAEHIARYGTKEDMRALDEMPRGSPYRLARAFRDLRSGRKDIGEALLKQLESNGDATIAEKAMEERIALQLKDGRISPMEAAEQFSSILPDARLSGREGLVRLLQADAYMRAKRWNDALAAIDQAKKEPMREVVELTPMLHQALKGVSQAAQGGQKAPQAQTGGALLHGAAMVRAHLPDMPPGPEKADILMSYGKMLSALGLLNEASQAFSSAIPMMDDPTQREAASESLADSYIKRGMLPDASRALSMAGDPALSKEGTAKKNRIVARIAMLSGKPEVAFYLLNGDSSNAASDMKAKIHENKEEWREAVVEVKKMADSLIPDQGDLSSNQQLLALRLASDASRAGDAGTLSWIVHKIGNRPFDDDTGRMFKLLVSPQ